VRPGEMIARVARPSAGQTQAGFERTGLEDRSRRGESSSRIGTSRAHPPGQRRASLLSDGTVLMPPAGPTGHGPGHVHRKSAAEILADMEDVAVVPATRTRPFRQGRLRLERPVFSGNAAVKAAEDLRAKVLAFSAGIWESPFRTSPLSPRRRRGKEGRSELAKIAHMSTRVGPRGTRGLRSFRASTRPYPTAPISRKWPSMSAPGTSGCGVSTPIRTAARHQSALRWANLRGNPEAVGHSLTRNVYAKDGRCLNP
jgi:hypothetical protein